MANPRRQNSTQLGATFMPGGMDDFYMPELVSPSPQRITPEVPEKIQDNLAHLELAAEPVRRMSGLQSPSPVEQGNPYNFPPPRVEQQQQSQYPQQQEPPPPQMKQEPPAPVAYQKENPFLKKKNSAIDLAADQPTFSPFPPLKDRPSNVPPSDDEKEGILEKARLPVLNCNDPEVQLSWAQDTLTYVDIAAQQEARISQNQGARSQTPNIEHQLKVDAVNVVSFLAEQHHPKAEFLKGMWLEFGRFGIRMDKKEAFRCYQRSAQRGYARAEYRMGMQFENSNDPEKALKHYSLGVEQGDSASNYRMGMMSLLGQHGQVQDFAKGVKMISYAAETADENAPQGAYVYGMLQARELPQVVVPEQYLKTNLPGARYNLEKAAYLGFAKAQTKMGTAYELSQLGCEFNPTLSLHYNALAAKQGEPEADMSISKWFLCGYEGVFEKNEELAFTYAQRAAQSGLSTAEFAMGYFYEVGIYVPEDLKVSRSWYEKAADHGNKDAQARIDGISRSKTLSRKDHEQMAVAKIKSQYGSHKGTRPERYRQVDTMPTIEDGPGNKLDMPEPKLPPSRAGYRDQASTSYPSYGQYGPPAARPASVAPYPLDDSNLQPPPLGRPTSAVGSQASMAPPRRSSYQPPKPPVEPDAMFGDNNYRGSAFPTFKPSPAPAVGQGRGRGMPPPSAYGSLSPYDYRKPAPTQVAPKLSQTPVPDVSKPPSEVPPKPKTPAIDIGFSAPEDPSGADRRRLQKVDTRLGPQPRKPGQDASPQTPQRDRLSSLPHPNMTPPRSRDSSPARRPVSAGRPSSSIPSSGLPQQRPVDGASLERPPKLQDPAAAGKTSNTPPPSSTITSKPPGKGPKTFTEMGLPPQKQENDCIVM